MDKISTILLVVLLSVFSASAGVAQGFSALARLDPARSSAQAVPDGLDVVLTISQPVPYRVHTLSDPARLVVDFREVDFSGLSADNTASFAPNDRFTGLRHGRIRDGWTRLVLDLAGPYAVDRAAMGTGAVDGSARIEISLRRVSEESFANRSGAPSARAFPDLAQVARPAARPAASPAASPDTGSEAAKAGPMVIVLDPGHGGIDPGAVRGDVHEADLMLTFARDLKETLLRSGDYEVVLTRDSDVFVSLEGRLDIARRAGADLFISLHADAVAEGLARGAQVYTLSEEASSRATAQLAARHDRADLLAGLDLSDQDDRVARILMSIAQVETTPRTEALASAMVAGLSGAGIRMHKRPREHAGFSVLKSVDIPSVLIEVGFISSPGELEKLQSPIWRAGAASGIANAVESWARQDLLLQALKRK